MPLSHRRSRSAPPRAERFTIAVDHSLLNELETFGARDFENEPDTPLRVRSLVVAVAVALLGLTTGCSMLPGGKEPATPAAEADPWAGFNNGYEKNEKPTEKAAAAKPDATHGAVE